MDTGYLWPVLGVVGGYFGSLLHGYLGKKGENLATHEDIDKLVKQVTAVTEATKAIEAKISGDVWDRQKRWELKREVLLDAMRKLSQLPGALAALHGVYSVDVEGASDERREGRERWSQLQTEFDASVNVVGLVCDIGVARAFKDACLYARNTATGMVAGNAEPVERWAAELGRKVKDAIKAARTELGLEKI